MGMNTFGLKEEIPAFIVEKAQAYNLNKVVLFGSRAKGTFNEKSDIDLAVIGGLSDEFKVTLEEDCPTLLEFDIIDMSQDISSELRERIENEGVVLYEICQL